MIYRGHDIDQAPNGLYEWTDANDRVHTGKVDTKGGYRTEEEAMNAIDAYLRTLRAEADKAAGR